MRIYRGLQSTFRIALTQFKLQNGQQPNLERAEVEVKKAAEQGADLIVVPEYFCFHPLTPTNIPLFAEDLETGPTNKLLTGLAKKHKVYLLGGSLPELNQGKVYNTCLGYDPDGKIIMKYSKLHRFDSQIPGLEVRESQVTEKGSNIGIFNTPFGKFGIGLCYDLRFALLARLYADKGCKMLLYPAMFTKTGPRYWDLLQRARAVDNQVYVATCASARDEKAPYVSWGHSGIVNPFGEIEKQAGFDDEIIVADIDFAVVDEARRQIPVLRDSRDDIYKLVSMV